MEEKVRPLEWNKNPVYISGLISGIFLIIVIVILYLNINPNFLTAGIIALIISGAVTAFLFKNQCPKCKRVFNLKHISNEVVKKWEEPKTYVEKTIYYYSDGFTQKDVKNGANKTFVARYEKHKDGYQCNKCQETHYKIIDLFLNRGDWERVTSPQTVTTSIPPPNPFGAIEPTYYRDKSGKRKSIPASVKEKLWMEYNGKKYEGPCFVCEKIIDTKNFEAGHVIPASKRGTDHINNLRPICKKCNGSMGDTNLYEFKKRYFSKRQ